MSRKRERYLWQAGIVFVLSCLALVLDWDILHTALIYWVGLAIGRFMGSGDEADE